MFDRDMPIIRSHGLSSPEGFVDVVTFVFATIQQPLQSVARQMADIRANGDTSKYLFGSKRGGYQYVVAHKEVLHAAMVAAVEVNDVVGAVDVLTNIPGLGVVKASFVAQMFGLEVACLDTHNLRSLGLPLTAFALPKGLKPASKRAKIVTYVKACQDTGGSRHWWNTWCNFVAGSRANKTLPTGDIVSAYHTSCVTGS